MKPKHLIVLSALALVAVIVAVVVGGRNREKKPDGLLTDGDRLFGDFSAENVTSIEIGDGENTVTLSTDGEQWGVDQRGGYSADLEKIRRVVDALRKLEVEQVMEAGNSVLGRFDLRKPGEGDGGEGVGKWAAFRSKDGSSVAEIVVGKNVGAAVTDDSNPFGGRGRGNYFRDLQRDGQVFVVEQAFGELGVRPTDWLERGTIRVARHKKITVTHPDGEQYVFSREDESAKMEMEGLSEEEEMNPANTATITAAFASPSFKDVMVGDEAKPENTGLAQPVKVDIETFDGFTYAVELGRVTPPAPSAEGEEAPTAADPRYFFRFQVSAQIPASRTVAEGTEETEEEKAQRDEEFAGNREKLEAQLADEQARAGAVYELDKWAAEKFFNKRDELVKEREIPEGTTPVPVPGSPVPLPDPPGEGAAIPLDPLKGLEAVSPALPVEDAREPGASGETPDEGGEAGAGEPENAESPAEEAD